MNVGTGIDISIGELAEKVTEIIGYKGKIEWDKSKPDGTLKQLNVDRLQQLAGPQRSRRIDKRRRFQK